MPWYMIEGFATKPESRTLRDWIFIKNFRFLDISHIVQESYVGILYTIFHVADPSYNVLLVSAIGSFCYTYRARICMLQW